MPRKIPKEIEESGDVEEVEDYEEGDEGENAEFEEEELAPAPTPRRKKANPRMRRPLPRQPVQPPQPAQRFGVVAPTNIRIADVETGEVIGEGEYAVYQALADIIARLERIEIAIGSMTE